MPSSATKVSAAILERFTSIPGAPTLRDRPAGYTVAPRDNLVGNLDDEILSDFEAGSGGELQGEAPKFCAIHSSSALATNSLGPMRSRPDLFNLAGLSNFNRAAFEKKLPTGLLGTPPNLDFFASGPSGCVAVESKFTEVLSLKIGKFASSYDGAIERLAEAPWASVYELLRERPDRFQRLDVAQLVKHYLGMRHSLQDRDGHQVLLYLFWEPTNAHELDEFRQHRDEFEQLSGLVEGASIEFRAQTHSALWSEWLDASSWPGIGSHVDALRRRYEFSV